jgi:hypothetical protein
MPTGDAAGLALLTKQNWEEYKFPRLLPRSAKRPSTGGSKSETAAVTAVDAGSHEEADGADRDLLDDGCANVVGSIREQCSTLNTVANSLRSQLTTASEQLVGLPSSVPDEALQAGLAANVRLNAFSCFYLS